MTFLERLDELMDRSGLNKRQLAIKTGIPQTTVYGWYDKGYEPLIYVVYARHILKNAVVTGIL